MVYVKVYLAMLIASCVLTISLEKKNIFTELSRYNILMYSGTNFALGIRALKLDELSRDDKASVNHSHPLGVPPV